MFLHYLWIPDVSFSVLRVGERVAQGGHDIPKEAIFRRYDKSLRNLFRYLPECDRIMCYDNSDTSHPLIFFMINGTLEVVNEVLYNKIQQKITP